MSELGPVVAFPARVRATFRWSLVVAAILGGLGLMLAAMYGAASFAGFAFLGLALGAGNSFLVQRAILRQIAAADPSRGALMRQVGVRLALITAIAAVVGVWFYPAGFGAFLGLAVFQVINTIVGAVPALKELRQ